MKIFNVTLKLTIVLLVVATMVLVVVVSISEYNRFWWVSTILYSISLILSCGNVIYTMWKPRRNNAGKRN